MGFAVEVEAESEARMTGSRGEGASWGWVRNDGNIPVVS